MDCRGFNDRLDALLAGGLVSAERDALDAHAAGCPRCAKLLALLSSEVEAGPAEAPEGLAEAVLARTSGSPCARAQELACDLADGILDPSHAEVARLHLDRCPECGRIARTLARLREDLPGLAEEAPGEELLARVLARTSLRRRRIARWRERAAGIGRLALLRPRFATEGAYLGSLVLTVLVAVPGSPLRGLPERALAAIRAPLTAPAAALHVRVAAIEARAVAFEARASESIEKRLSVPAQDAARRARGAIGSIRRLTDRVGRFVGSLRGDIDASNDGTTPAGKDAKEKRP